MNSYLKRLSLVAAALTVAAVLFLPAMLHGDEFNLKTYITVNQPFQVPGAVLQPNVKYVLRRLDANAGTNHVVRILNADETQVISTFFGISDVRLEPADDTILTFYETAPGYPKPVHSWFYPGRTIGLEFIYPKETRAEITAHMHGAEAATVLTAAENSDQNESLSQQPSEEPAPMAQDNKAPATDQEVQQEKPAEPAPAPAVEDNTTPTTESDNNTAPAEELPKTAGELPLVGLLGAACLGLKIALKRV
jgi:hypothetical protein